jgi:hypothetical protein
MNELNINSFDLKQLIGMCTLLIGSGGSGKSVLIREIMFKMKNSIPNAVVLCPTAN